MLARYFLQPENPSFVDHIPLVHRIIRSRDERGNSHKRVSTGKRHAQGSPQELPPTDPAALSPRAWSHRSHHPQTRAQVTTMANYTSTDYGDDRPHTPPYRTYYIRWYMTHL